MKAIQYTIRNIPEPVDRYLRKRAKISGRSLNQVVIDELSEKAPRQGRSVIDDLDWFIGSDTLDDSFDQFIAEHRKEQRELTRKQWEKEDKRNAY